MKKLPTFLALALACALPLSASDNSETVRHFGQEISLDGAQKVSLDFPVGEVTVTGSEGRQVQVDVLLKCHHNSDRCGDAAKRVRLVYRVSGGTLHVEIKDWPKMSGKGLQVEAKVEVPRDLPLIANLGVGQLNINDMEADVDGDLGVGEIRAKLSHAAFAQASLDTGIGESTLLADGHRFEHGGLISRPVRWHDGPGRSKISFDCGVGQIDVTLR